MKAIITAIFLITSACHAHVIGEIFEETSFGKPGPRTKIEPSQSKPGAIQRVYVVRQSTIDEEFSFIIVVSAKTGRIISISESVDSIYDAVLKATYYCEGEVSLPTKAHWGSGLELENVPDMTQKGRSYRFTVTKDRGLPYRLESSCDDYLFK